MARQTVVSIAIVLAGLALLTIVTNAVVSVAGIISSGVMSLSYSITVFAMLVATRQRLVCLPQRVHREMAWTPILVLVLGVGLQLSSTKPLLTDLDTILLAFNVGLFEELLFRRLVLERFLPRAEQAIFVSAFLFSITHLSNLALGQGLNDTMFQLFYAFVFGIFLSVLRISFGTLTIPVLFHCAVNNLSLPGGWQNETLVFLTAILMASWFLWNSVATRGTAAELESATGRTFR